MAELEITSNDLGLRKGVCLSALLYLFVCPQGLYFMVLWSVRMCVILVVVGSNIRSITGGKRPRSVFSHSVYHFFSPSLVLSLFFLFQSHFLPQTYALSHMITARLWMLWCLMLYEVLHAVFLSEIKASLSSIILSYQFQPKLIKREKPEKESLQNAFLAHSYPQRGEAGHHCSPSIRDNFTAG